jgi:hypothetical protein
MITDMVMLLVKSFLFVLFAGSLYLIKKEWSISPFWNKVEMFMTSFFFLVSFIVLVVEG